MTFFEFYTIISNLPTPLDDMNITIAGFSNPDDNAEIRLNVSYNRGDDDDLSFRIEITGLKDYKIVKTDIPSIGLLDEHPLLWNFNGSHSQLYFSGPIRDTKVVLADLYRVNARVFKGLLPLDAYFNCGTDVLKVLGGHSGLVASGPADIMDAYAGVLSKHDVTHSLLGPYGPGSRNGGKKNCQVLLMGDCYFIGNDFNFFEIH